MAEKNNFLFFYISEKKFLWRVKTEADVFEGEKSHCPDQVRLSPLIFRLKISSSSSSMHLKVIINYLQFSLSNESLETSRFDDKPIGINGGMTHQSNAWNYSLCQNSNLKLKNFYKMRIKRSQQSETNKENSNPKKSKPG